VKWRDTVGEIYSRASKKEHMAHTKEERLSIKQLKTLFKRSGSNGLFSSFATFPNTTYFESQEDGEEVVLFLRQHIIVNLPWVLLVMLAYTLPSVFIFFPPYAILPANFQFVITTMWYLFVTGFALAKFMGWFFNIYIVTDERIVDIDFINILYRKISTAKIDEIQDVNVIASGAFETFFNYGSIVIQTAAQIPEFEFLKIPQPDKVGSIIHQMIDLEEQEQLEGRVK
jgi:membrane protein YdbS with pleckstrin-like domain